MLRIVESQSASRAKTYYTTSDYYTEGQELVGTFHGKGAERLGLKGTVQPDVWEALCENRNPFTGEQLTPRIKGDRRVGYDFNFHCPKSLSVLYAMTEDDRLLQAFRDSVDETMQEIESEMQTRVRRGGKDEDRTTGNMMWGEFVHLTSRPVDGLPDAHLHAHCFVFNGTYDSEEERWKAGQFGSLKRDGPYFEGRFHLRLTEKLQELGLDIERTATGWELAGVASTLIDKFSRRRDEIEAEAARLGITDPDKKGEIGAKTRSNKQKDLTMPELRLEWLQRMTQEEQDSIHRTDEMIGGPSRRPVFGDAREAVDLAADHCFERQSVVPERKLLAESYKRAYGSASVSVVDETFTQKPLIIRERKKQRVVTTQEVLSEEKRMLGFAREGRGTRPALAEGPHIFKNEIFNEDQRAAVHHVLRSRDKVTIVRGVAGVGKTSMMKETVDAIQERGTTVLTVAPSAKASRGVLRKKGFDNADTLSRFLIDDKLQDSIRGQVLWIDEAGLVGTKTMAKVFRLAGEKDFRVVLSGDRKQHGSVERGAALRLLETEAGLETAEIREIVRQRDRFKQAVKALSEFRTEKGFEILDDLGWVREVPDEDRYAVLAKEYLQTIGNGDTALVVSPSHREADKVAREIRDGMRTSGRLASEEVELPMLINTNLTEAERRDAVNYDPQDVVIFSQNAKGFRKGARLTVGQNAPPVEFAARFQLYHSGKLRVAAGERLRITKNGESLDGHRLNNGDIVEIKRFDEAGNLVTTNNWTIDREYGHLAYGYVSTSYASQGTDVKKVFIGQSADSFGASSREQFYVSCSRGENEAVIFTSNKDELLQAIKRSDERLSATELLAGSPVLEHDRIARIEWNNELSRENEKNWHKDLVYER